MAVSIANTLTPRMWKGEPLVIIRGSFTLGLAYADGDTNAYAATHLYMGDNSVNVASSSAETTFSLQVLGRAGQVTGGPVYSGIGVISNFTYHRTDPAGGYPTHPYADGEDGPFVAPRIYCYRNSYINSWQGYGVSDAGDSNARLQIGNVLGTIVAPDVRIVLRGSLSRLDITKMKAVGFSPKNGVSPPYGIAKNPRLGAEWRAIDVHVYDNPQLRGNVVAGNVPVIWG